MQRTLSSPPVTEYVANKQLSRHEDVVGEVRAAIAAHDVVVVGMGINPHPGRARKLLDEAGIAHTDLDYGSYLSQWKPRLALKIWAGWPTFPMVFVKGTLIGGADQTKHMLADGSLKALLDAPRES